jgi:hemimethylated DNA binding protein
VLVDGSAATTYAAQTSLLEDDSTDPVSHPLVEALFESFEDGRYERNEARIQGWE